MNADCRDPEAAPSVSNGQTARLLVLVFIGGTLGSIARELAAPMLSQLPAWVAVLLVNVSACFLVGWLYGAQDRLHHHLLQFAAVGFCGGFSTFSHFADQVYNLAAQGDVMAAVGDVAGSIVLGVAAAYLGDLVGQRGGGAS